MGHMEKYFVGSIVDVWPSGDLGVVLAATAAAVLAVAVAAAVFLAAATVHVVAAFVVVAVAMAAATVHATAAADFLGVATVAAAPAPAVPLPAGG